MDGLIPHNNILVIGLTNRRDLIDPAVLRSGRFEIHIEIQLPDADGRREVLDVHTHVMREHGVLAPDVDLEALVEMTEGFSPADLESIIKRAKSRAISDAMRAGSLYHVIIHMTHLLDAFEDVVASRSYMTEARY